LCSPLPPLPHLLENQLPITTRSKRGFDWPSYVATTQLSDRCSLFYDSTASSRQDWRPPPGHPVKPVVFASRRHAPLDATGLGRMSEVRRRCPVHENPWHWNPPTRRRLVRASISPWLLVTRETFVRDVGIANRELTQRDSPAQTFKFHNCAPACHCDACASTRTNRGGR
jgi:hypothetical protein